MNAQQSFEMNENDGGKRNMPFRCVHTIKYLVTSSAKAYHSL